MFWKLIEASRNSIRKQATVSPDTENEYEQKIGALVKKVKID